MRVFWPTGRLRQHEDQHKVRVTEGENRRIRVVREGMGDLIALLGAVGTFMGAILWVVFLGHHHVHLREELAGLVGFAFVYIRLMPFPPFIGIILLFVLLYRLIRHKGLPTWLYIALGIIGLIVDKVLSDTLSRYFSSHSLLLGGGVQTLAIGSSLLILSALPWRWPRRNVPSVLLWVAGIVLLSLGIFGLLATDWLIGGLLSLAGLTGLFRSGWLIRDDNKAL